MVNWDAIGAIAELLGAIGVIASLFYLASQIRRNSESVEAATALSVSQNAQLRLLVPAQTPELAAALGKSMSGEELSATEFAQLSFFNRASVRGIENTFIQHRRGNLAAEVWRGHESLLRHNIQGAVFDEWWNREQESYDPEFRALVNRLLAQ